MHMRIEAIRVVGRYRRDLGDIRALAKSIAAVGLLNPVTVTSDGQLIAGQRRLEAAKSLGWNQIGCVVADDLEAATARLAAERDENTERKPMTPEELVELGLALEELERPVAHERKVTAFNKASDRAVGTDASSENPEGGRRSEETRSVVGKALGMGGTTYNRAKAVVKAARDAGLSPSEQEVAREALLDMNATGNISGNYEKIREAGLTDMQQKAQRNGGQGLRQRAVMQDSKKQRLAIDSAAASLSGIALGLKRIEELHPDITSEEAAQWVGDLSEARRVIDSLIKRLKERTNG